MMTLKTKIFAMIFALIASAITVNAQGTTFTGTAVIYGSGFNTRTITRTFTLNIKGVSPASEVDRLEDVYERGGQTGLLDALNDNPELGRFAFTGTVGLPVTAVWTEETADGTKLTAIFPRWIGFGELRYGRRSVDYPFSYVEIMFDREKRTGEGTFIPAARLRIKDDDTIEVEDFGTFPGRLMGVQMRGNPLP